MPAVPALPHPAEPAGSWGPPEDRILSPRTGWTRAHWEAMADRLLTALVPYGTPRFAQYRLPGRASWSGAHSDGLEGFARSFLLAAFRIAGAHTAAGDPVGRQRVEALAERYASGLAAGTEPGGAEAWPPITERSQPMVEAASVAIGLHETRPWIWDRLDDRVRQHVVDWLAGFVGKNPVDNNWRLFQVVAEQFLASVGGPYRQAEIDGGLDRIEDWYAGDGWYSDGDGRNFDHYIGWAMHFYPLLWARIAGSGPGADPARTAVHRDRLRLFLAGYQHLFGADGAPMHQGRSLTYRYAAVAPMWMGALADATPLAPGLTRRLASGALRHFADRGVPDGEGLLRLGWYGPFLPVTQSYSGPASPYWASKGFLGLLLPPDHAVWTDPELPLPVEESDRYVALPVPGWLLHGTRRDGIVRLLNHGTDHHVPEDAEAVDNPHYTKLAYSSHTAPQTGPGARERLVDGHIALVSPDGAVSHRTVVHPLALDARTASSWYEARLPGDHRTYRITTTALPYGPCEVRVHRIEAPDGIAAGLTVRDGGQAIAGGERPRTGQGDGVATVRRADGLTGAAVALYGWDAARVEHAVDVNAFGPHSAVPYLTAAVVPGGDLRYVSLFVLSGEPAEGAGVAGRPWEGFSVTVADDGVRVGFPDGSERVVDAAGPGR